MTSPAVICVASACVCLYVALITARLSRAKGWEEQRLLALAAVSAAASILCDLAQTMDGVAPHVVIVASRWQLVCLAVSVAAWLYFSRAVLKLSRSWVDPTWTIATVALSASAIIPGFVYENRLLPPVVVPWAGATYHMPQPTPLFGIVLFLLCLGALIILFRFARAVIGGQTEFRWHMIGCVVILIIAVNDSLVSSSVYSNVLLLDAGYMLPVAATAMAQTASLVQISLDLDTSNIRLEGALEAANSAARVKDAFLTTTSHELRTPLNTIINVPEGLLQYFRKLEVARCPACGSRFELAGGEIIDALAKCSDCGAAGLLQEEWTAMDLEPAQIVQHLESVERAGRHLLSVVDDILNYASLEAGAVTLRHETVTVHKLFDDLQHIMIPVARKKGVALEFIEEQPELAFRADPVRWLQVMINLISNALKFSSSGERVQIRVKARDGGVTFSVRDFGVGIAPEHHKLVFEAFRQVDHGHTRAVGGTGLGLAIAHGLVRLHAGTISLKSALGEGSTFSVWLPARQPATDFPINGSDRRREKTLST